MPSLNLSGEITYDASLCNQHRCIVEHKCLREDRLLNTNLRLLSKYQYHRLGWSRKTDKKRKKKLKRKRHKTDCSQMLSFQYVFNKKKTIWAHTFRMPTLTPLLLYITTHSACCMCSITIFKYVSSLTYQIIYTSYWKSVCLIAIEMSN